MTKRVAADRSTLPGKARPRAATAEEVQQEINDNKLYTPREAAEILSLNPQTLANWRAGQGSVELPFIKIGRSVKYTHRALMDYIRSRRVITNAGLNKKLIYR